MKSSLGKCNADLNNNGEELKQKKGRKKEVKKGKKRKQIYTLEISNY